MASCTVRIFSASSSGISMSKASSKAITSSTVSSESAPRSSTNDALVVTSPSSTPSCSTIICFTFSSTPAIRSPNQPRPGAPGCASAVLLAHFGMLVDVVDGILHGADLFRILVGNLDIEVFLERHHQFDRVERVGAQIVHKRCAGGYFGLFHAQLLRNNLLYLLRNLFQLIA